MTPGKVERRLPRGLSVWEKAEAGAGLLGALSLGIGWAIRRTTHAALGGSDADFARALLAERMKWEWVTLAWLLGGILVVWFTSSLAERLRAVEGEPGRIAEAAFGLGVLWAGVWLFSAFFNSASIFLAADYGDPAGARIAGVLARETPGVLTGSIVFAWLLATAFITLRGIGLPRIYAYATAALTLVILLLAVVDWYGAGTLSPAIVGLALLWTAGTSAVLTFVAPSRTAW
jgi:hypothetical protein